jgi:hypothetical protein
MKNNDELRQAFYNEIIVEWPTEPDIRSDELRQWRESESRTLN